MRMQEHLKQLMLLPSADIYSARDQTYLALSEVGYDPVALERAAEKPNELAEVAICMTDILFHSANHATPDEFRAMDKLCSLWLHIRKT